MKAHKGAVCIDDLDDMPVDVRAAMLDPMSKQRISVNKWGINATLRTETAVVAAGNPKYGRVDPYEPVQDQFDFGSNFLSRFDLVFTLADQPDPDRDSTIIQHILDARGRRPAAIFEVGFEPIDGHSELYPLNCLRQDDYYFSKRIARCDDSDSEQATRLNEKKSARRTHYFHTLSKHIVQRCVDKEIGTIVVGDLSGIREDAEKDKSKNWGKHGNLDLHSRAFDRFTDLLEYKAEMEGITVEKVSERDTSKACSCCGRKRDANRVERGLYVCDECGTVANADVNGAENIRQKVSPSSPNLSVNRSNGWLAQPSTFLFDKGTGAFAPQERVTS